MCTSPTRIVVTGGPGSGKTTLLDTLAAAGYACSAEAGRGIIRDQAALGGPGLPWRDRELFAELMLCWEMRSHRMATGITFFDRGLPDIIGYLRVEGLAVPAHVHAAAGEFRYAARVFLAPPWPAIYRTDEERKQPAELAERTCEAVADAYAEHGYELVELPRLPVAERARFVLDSVEQ